MRILQNKISYKVIFIFYFLIFVNITFAEQDSSVILGCTNDMALNYNPNATKEDGSCVYTQFQFNQLIKNQEVLGSMDSSAINYSPKATKDDGSCKYEIDNNKDVAVLSLSFNNISNILAVCPPWLGRIT